jgi:septum site-determining protein MinC
MDYVTIKGSKDGLIAYVNSEDYDSVKNELIEKIKSSGGFFTGSKLSIIDKSMIISEERYEELKGVLKELYNVDLRNDIKGFEEKKDKVFRNIYEGRTKFIKNTIRSGQKITYNGNIVVIGDVNSGAEIIASGNIVILGVLRGIAHAGSNGNSKAFIASYIMQPSILRIANIIVRAPDESYERPNTPEIAIVRDDTIIVEPYLPNKFA